MPSTDVKFDLSQTSPKASSAGYTRSIRESLKNEGLVKFRDAFIKKLIKVPLSSNLLVSSYKPSEMGEKTNFFTTVSNWSEASLYLASWMRSHFVDNVFVLVEKTITQDANGQDIETVAECGDLFKIWHQVTLQQVFDSCQLYFKYSASAVEAQNLNLSWELILANVDSDLRATIIAEVGRFIPENADCAQSGPMAFWVVANRIIRTTEALSHNVISGLMGMGLIHFKGENVIQAVSIIRNVLLFLGHNTSRDRTPTNLMEILFDIFLRCSSQTFVNYVRNLKDFNRSIANSPEELFKLVQDYYNDLLTKPNGWLRNTKSRTAFLATVPEMLTADIHAKYTGPRTSLHEEEEGGTGGTKEEEDVERDAKGRIIDRNPPKNGVTTRTVDGREEKWCGKCPKGGRWGNHDSAGHDKWRKDFQEYKKKMKEKKQKKKEQKENKEEEDQGDTPSSTVPSMHRNTMAQRIANSQRNTTSTDYDSDGSF